MRIFGYIIILTSIFAFNTKAYSFYMPLDTMVYDMPEQMPQFPGGADAMEHFISDNIKYPTVAKEKGLQGKVYVQFVVEKDGAISNVKIRRGSHASLNKEAIRVIKMMPNWKPGSMRGKVVRVRYTIPITFALN